MKWARLKSANWRISHSGLEAGLLRSETGDRGFGRAPFTTRLTVLSQKALEREVPKQLGLQKRAVAVKGCRNIGKRDLKLNDALPHIEVDVETYEVRADGELLRCEPLAVLPMAQRYFLF